MAWKNRFDFVWPLIESKARQKLNMMYSKLESQISFENYSAIFEEKSELENCKNSQKS